MWFNLNFDLQGSTSPASIRGSVVAAAADARGEPSKTGRVCCQAGGHEEGHPGARDGTQSEGTSSRT